MYRPLIIKSEFRSQVKLGANVGTDPEIESFIRDFQEVEFEPLICDNFYNDLMQSLSLRPQLQSLLDYFIKPYLIYGTYGRFLLWHGINVSQFGLRQNNEDTSEPISDKARAELISDIRSKTNIYLSKMNKEIKRMNYTFDGIVYSFNNCCDTSRPGPKIGIKQVGKLNTRRWHDH